MHFHSLPNQKVDCMSYVKVKQREKVSDHGSYLELDQHVYILGAKGGRPWTLLPAFSQT